MRESSLRQALTASIISVVIGVVTLALGAFIAPIPSDAITTSPGQVVTALLIRTVLMIVGIGVAVFLAYRVGFRIQEASNDDLERQAPQPDPSASSPLVSMFTTPGPRRDAMVAGAIVMGAYWTITSLYIIAFGNSIGNVGAVSTDIGTFLTQRIVFGLMLTVTGLGCGGIGARAALARKLTSKAFSTPAIPSALPPLTDPAPADPSAPEAPQE